MRDVRLNLRLTKAERELIRAKAAQLGLKPAQWLRMMVLKVAQRS